MKIVLSLIALFFSTNLFAQVQPQLFQVTQNADGSFTAVLIKPVAPAPVVPTEQLIQKELMDVGHSKDIASQLSSIFSYLKANPPKPTVPPAVNPAVNPVMKPDVKIDEKKDLKPDLKPDVKPEIKKISLSNPTIDDVNKAATDAMLASASLRIAMSDLAKSVSDLKNK